MSPHAVRPPSRITDISTANRQDEENDLAKEPQPAAALLPGTRSLLPAGAGRGRRVGHVQVLGADRHDVVVVAELARLRAEAQIGGVGDHRWLVGLETKYPVVLLLVLHLKLELLVLEVRQAELGWDGSVSDAACRAARELLLLAVRILIVGSLSVAHHGHHVGENRARAVVLVRIYENAKALKVVDAAKNWSRLRACLGDPHGEAVAEELVLAVNLEFDFDFPIRCGQGHF